MAIYRCAKCDEFVDDDFHPGEDFGLKGMVCPACVDEMPLGCYCSACRQPAKAVCVDFGIGPYEFWGKPGVDTDKRLVSECCEADCFEDAGLTFPYEPAELEGWERE